MNIQWYPGHMTKTKRMLIQNISLVDIVIELLDARIPYSSRNPDIDALAANKKRIIVLNKSDLADEAITSAWKRHYEAMGFCIVTADCSAGKGLSAVTDASKELMREKSERLRQKGRINIVTRAMVLGVPNVGKSTLINKYAKKNIAKTADKPGVTRDKQWIRINDTFELLDTPGILWPKFDSETVGINLALTGAINDNIVDIITLAKHLITKLSQINPSALIQRYKLQTDLFAELMPDEMLDEIGGVRGFKIKGGQTDFERTAIMLIDEFRGGKLGRISLEKPN